MVISVTVKPVAAFLRRRGRLTLIAGGAAVALTVLTTVSAAASPEFISTVPVGTAPLGVGINPSTDVAYVANAGDNTVSVINGRNEKVIATIPVGTAPHAVATDWVTNRAFVANVVSNTVSVINGRTNLVTATIPVGTNPVGVAVDWQTDTVYVANFTGNTISVINGHTDTVTATIQVGTSATPWLLTRKPTPYTWRTTPLTRCQ